jgi:hypothetical protein
MGGPNMSNIINTLAEGLALKEGGSEAEELISLL